MTIIYDKEKANNLPSTVSFISWARMKLFIEDAVALKDNEKLSGIEITNDGIKALIETKTPPHAN